MILITFGIFQNPLISPKNRPKLLIFTKKMRLQKFYFGDTTITVTNIDVTKLTCFPFRGTQVSEQDVHNVHIDQLAANFSSVHFRILSLTYSQPLLANHGKLIQKFFWNFHFPSRHTDRFTGKLVHSNFLTETLYDM